MKCPKLSQKQISELNNIVSRYQSSGPEVRKAQTILLVNEEVEPSAITAITEYSRRQSFDLRKRYLKQGLTVIEDKRKGKPKEILTKKQRDEVLKVLKTKAPNECSRYYNSDYWTTSILGEYIKRTYNVWYKSKTSVYVLFRQAKFSYHKPDKTHENRDENEVREWQEKTRPVIEKVWGEPNIIVLCEDEIILSNQTTTQKIWLPQGEYPRIEIAKKRENRSIYGFLNVKTGVEHAFKTLKQNMFVTVKVLKKIRKIYPTEKLLILWDGPGWHRGSKVQEFVKEDKNIETIHFPKYAPDQNPQEHVWKNGRDKITHNTFIKDIDKTVDNFIKYLCSTKFSYSLLGFSADS